MNQPIRILHVLQRMEAAGVQTLLMNIYRNIDREKVQFDFLVHYKTPQFFDDEIEKLGGRIYRLSFKEDNNFIKYIIDLDNFFKNHHEYKIVHAHMNSLGTIYLHYAKKYKIPVRIAHSHTNSSALNGIKRLLISIMNKLYSKNATDLFACSEAAGKYMFGNKKFKVINNAIDSKRFIFDVEKRKEIRDELDIKDNFVVGHVGRFHPQKNHKFLIEIFAKLKEIKDNSKLLLIGTGPLENEIKSQIKKLNLENDIIFLGNREDMDRIYQAMDVFLFPSLFEGLGIVGVEAQAAGTPTVCTDTLPKEIDVTPIIHRVSLNQEVSYWVREIEIAANDLLKHNNMESYIKNANYDINKLAFELETFYLEKMNLLHENYLM